MPLALPAEKTKPLRGFPVNDTWLIFGAPKIGKTSLAAQFPEPLIIDLEHGATYVECYKIMPTDLIDLRGVYVDLAKDKNRFKTIVIDTIDVVNVWIEKEVCDERGLTQMGEGTYGADWADARKRVLHILEKFKELHRNIVVVAHSKQATIETESEKARRIDLPGKLSRFFTAAVDNIIYCYGERNDKGKIVRKMSLQPYEGIEAGSRNPQLAGKLLPMEFKALLKCFENTNPKKEAK